MSYVKSMMAEAKTCLRLTLVLALTHFHKLLRGVMYVLLLCIKFVVLMLALPLVAPKLFHEVSEDLSTKEEKA